MTNRVALITGCGKRVGIGSATARMLAASGIAVVVSDIGATGVEGDWHGLHSLVEEIEAAGGAAWATRGDVTQEADANGMVAQTLDRHGRLDILVNNAGAPHGDDRKPFEEIPLAAWESIMAINARGPFLMSRAATVPMRAQKWGRIVTISSSVSLWVRRQRQVVYAASKAAVIGFTKGLAVDLADSGITVNAICPGAIRTSRSIANAASPASADAALAAVTGNIPLGRFGTPEEVAGIVTFLASCPLR